MKTLIPEDFKCTEGTVECLIAWGVVQKNPIGENLINRDFITRKDLLLDFINYWTDEAPKAKRKKDNWQSTFKNHIKKQWAYEKNQFEYNRHKRSDSGGSGDFFAKALSNDPKPKVVPERKYKLPVEREPVEPMSMEAAFQELNRALK